MFLVISWFVKVVRFGSCLEEWASIDSMGWRFGRMCQVPKEEKEKGKKLLDYSSNSKTTQYQTEDRLKERQRRQEKSATTRVMSRNRTAACMLHHPYQ